MKKEHFDQYVAEHYQNGYDCDCCKQHFDGIPAFFLNGESPHKPLCETCFEGIKRTLEAKLFKK